jgi:5-hydroxyisourate hydrolase
MAATLSTHVLDTARGTPAAGVGIALVAIEGDVRTTLGAATTDADGRIPAPFTGLGPGTYELVFNVDAYFARFGADAFYDAIAVRFRVAPDAEKYHVPLLLSPWGYSTYRGS